MKRNHATAAKKPTDAQFSQVYYQEKSLALQSCAILAQMMNSEFLPENEQTEKAIADAVEFLGSNVTPFVRPIDADAANDALKLLKSKE